MVRAKMVIKELTQEEFEKELNDTIKKFAEEFKISESSIENFVNKRNKLIDKYDKDIINSERLLSLYFSIIIYFKRFNDRVDVEDDYDEW